MSAEREIMRLAEEFAADSQGRTRELETKLLKAQKDVAHIQAQLDASNLAFENLKKFRLLVDGKPQCPRCGVRGIQTALGQRTGAPKLDKFECSVCFLDVHVAYGL